eukprot:GHRQ01022888.1.p1 GENE.GHRQ01022888.1~~GHRQ01022888.1.p1  ORF type:complete len:168 (-),score=21.69 GHRQ01022888.1:525-1028(-)
MSSQQCTNSQQTATAGFVHCRPCCLAQRELHSTATGRPWGPPAPDCRLLGDTCRGMGDTCGGMVGDSYQHASSTAATSQAAAQRTKRLSSACLPCVRALNLLCASLCPVRSQGREWVCYPSGCSCVCYVACSYSIHVNKKSSEELKEAQAGLPLPVPGTANCFACGW